MLPFFCCPHGLKIVLVAVYPANQSAEKNRIRESVSYSPNPVLQVNGKVLSAKLFHAFFALVHAVLVAFVLLTVKAVSE